MPPNTTPEQRAIICVLNTQTTTSEQIYPTSMTSPTMGNCPRKLGERDCRVALRHLANQDCRNAISGHVVTHHSGRGRA